MIASWLLDLTAVALAEDPQLAKFAGRVSDSGEGRWTIKAGIDEGVPSPVLTDSLYERFSFARLRQTSPTSCFRPCATSSADTWRRRQGSSLARNCHDTNMGAPFWRSFGSGRRSTATSAKGPALGEPYMPDTGHPAGELHRHNVASMRDKWEINMNIEILADISNALAKGRPRPSPSDARAAVAARGRFIMAVSGGHTPWVMLRELANEEVPWANVHVFQIDERIAPAGDPDRNSLICAPACWSTFLLCRRDQIYAMPVEKADSEAAAKQYAQTLEKIAGKPPVLDLAHLGLGPDGHTASLVPNDSVLNVTDADVGITGVYMGRRRMTLTYPVLNRARRILWLVERAEKVSALAKLRAADKSVPGGPHQPDTSAAARRQGRGGSIAQNQFPRRKPQILRRGRSASS